ncbi:hypothetical protein [Rhodoferax aquaticus]|uniref:DUF3108 domain-containing protein n=1 Tax=Rhodoferax aquaticus TaxID=2527691 RepID=A0A515EUZ2_9BURK|nr:hypothetical protein [Rhodoferax aquaticus]QDL56494.1 hypothetical protein EXZ61_21335 [Rhodoferax aquaticus]
MSAGALVYRGDTFAQRTPAGDPLYRYERRVLAVSNGLSASHITRDPAGRVIIVESAQVSPSYALRSFVATNQQAGFSGRVQISSDGRRVNYELNDNGKLSQASEEVTDPVVSGPSMFGFILKHWEPLVAGAKVPVRMLVLRDKTTYGFDVKLEKQDSGQTAFTITPSSFLIRMAIAPLRVVFDTSSKTAVRYEGRVPPMQNVSGKLKDLDARVEYTTLAPTYR